jgi:hypothetical protein
MEATLFNDIDKVTLLEASQKYNIMTNPFERISKH